MGTLLERTAIKNYIEPKYFKIVDLLEEEIDNTKKIYDIQNALRLSEHSLVVHKNMASISGGLKWCHELKKRFTKPMEYFNKLVIDHPVNKSEQMSRVNRKHNELVELLDGFIVDVYENWCNHVGSLANNNIEKHLIARDSSANKIQTNFDPEVKKLSFFLL
jgi:uncharacterized protein YecA (UPF0149 family)